MRKKVSKYCVIKAIFRKNFNYAVAALRDPRLSGSWINISG
jgi:hypothetical protein